MKRKPKKVVIAAGGTGGHLFPAQAVAEQLAKGEIDLLFAGAGLSASAYFDREKFAYRDIDSKTPYKGSLFKSLAALLKGTGQAWRLLRQEKPDLVVGFGSFHAFPVLCAAALKRIPIALFEANAVPGKVVRLFSKLALFTAVFFPDAKAHLKGATFDVEIPLRKKRRCLPTEEARRLFGLEPDLFTLLVFGGSQGAKRINQALLDLLPHLKNSLPFQLIHFTGNKETAQAATDRCKELGIPCYIRDFEPQMDAAWSAADIAICRSGASTVSELLHHEVPAILVPYPFAADKHQAANASHVEKAVGGAVHLPENTLSTEILHREILNLAPLEARLERKRAIGKYKAEQKKGEMPILILEYLCQL